MNRRQYMDQLAYLLQDISEDERREALEFYEDYFDEAGPGQEDEVIAKLGIPEQVAAQIKDGLQGKTEEGEYTEQGYTDPRFSSPDSVPEQYTALERWRAGNGSREEKAEEKQTEDGAKMRKTVCRTRMGGGLSFGQLLLYILLGVIIGLPVLSVLASLALGAVALLFGLAVTAVAAVAALFVAAVAVEIMGLVYLFASPAVGISTMGAGFILLAIAVLALSAAVWFCRSAVPAFVRGIADMLSRLFHRRYRRKERFA